MLKSRKMWAAIVGLILIFVNAWLNEAQVDPDTVTNAIMGVVAALMASIAWEDGQKARAEAVPTTTVTTPASNVTVSTSDDNLLVPPQPMIGRMG